MKENFPVIEGSQNMIYERPTALRGKGLLLLLLLLLNCYWYPYDHLQLFYSRA